MSFRALVLVSVLSLQTMALPVSVPQYLTEYMIKDVKGSTQGEAYANNKFYRLASIEHFTQTYTVKDCGFDISPLSGFKMTYQSTIGLTDEVISIGTTDSGLVDSVGTVTVSDHINQISASAFDKDAVFNCGDGKDKCLLHIDFDERSGAVQTIGADLGFAQVPYSLTQRLIGFSYEIREHDTWKIFMLTPIVDTESCDMGEWPSVTGSPTDMQITINDGQVLTQSVQSLKDQVTLTTPWGQSCNFYCSLPGAPSTMSISSDCYTITLTSTSAVVGVYSVTLRFTSDLYPGFHIPLDLTPFTVTINSCSVDSVTITNFPAPRVKSILSTTPSLTPAISLDPYCPSDLTYDFQVQIADPSGVIFDPQPSPEIVTFDGSTMQFTELADQISHLAFGIVHVKLIVVVTDPGGGGSTQATDSYELTLINPCDSATIDPANAFAVQRMTGSVYEAAETQLITAPFDSLSESYGQYLCGDFDFSLQGTIPSWLSIQSSNPTDCTLAIETHDYTDSYAAEQTAVLRIGLVNHPSIYKDYTFDVDVICQVQQVLWNDGGIAKTLQYWIGVDPMPMHYFGFDSYQQPECGTYPVSFRFQFDPTEATFSWMTSGQIQGRISVSTNDLADEGIYQFVMESYAKGDFSYTLTPSYSLVESNVYSNPRDLTIELINPCKEITSSQIGGSFFVAEGINEIHVPFQAFNFTDAPICGEFQYSIVSQSYGASLFTVNQTASEIVIDTGSMSQGLVLDFILEGYFSNDQLNKHQQEASIIIYSLELEAEASVNYNIGDSPSVVKIEHTMLPDESLSTLMFVSSAGGEPLPDGLVSLDQQKEQLSIYTQNYTTAGTYEIEVIVIFPEHPDWPKTTLEMQLQVTGIPPVEVEEVIEQPVVSVQVEQKQQQLFEVKIPTPTEEFNGEVPVAKIHSVDMFGNVLVKFTQDMFIPDFSKLLEGGLGEARQLADEQPMQELSDEWLFWQESKQDFIQVIVLPQENVDFPRNLEFKWNVLSYQLKQVKLELLFDNAIEISSLSKKDKLYIVLNKEFFVSKGGRSLDNNFFEFTLPAQFPRTMVTQVVTKGAEGVGTTGSLALTSNYVLNFLLAGSLNQLWALVRSQQIIVLLPLYKISLPSNASFFFNVLMQIAAFEVMDMDDSYTRLSGEATDPLSDNFGVIGFNSMFFVNNMGTMGLTIAIIPLVYVIRPLLLPFKRQRHIAQVRRKLKKDLYWGFPIRVLTESYLIVVICAMINIRWVHLNSLWKSLNFLSSVAILLVSLALLILVWRLLSQHKGKLKDKEIRLKYGAFYEYLRFDIPKNGLEKYVVFYYIRRIALSISVVFLGQQLVIQFFIFIFTAITSIILVGFIKPYVQRRDNNQELVNEVICIIIMYHIFCFTDWLPDADVKYNLGFSCLAFNCLNLATNLTTIFYVSFKTCKRNLKLQVYRKKLARQRLTNKHRVNVKAVLYRRADYDKSEEMSDAPPQDPSSIMLQILINQAKEHYDLKDQPSIYQQTSKQASVHEQSQQPKVGEKSMQEHQNSEEHTGEQQQSIERQESTQDLIHNKQHTMVNTRLGQNTILEQDYLFDSFFGGQLLVKPREELSISSLDFGSSIDFEDKSIESLMSSKKQDQKEDWDKNIGILNNSWQPQFESQPSSGLVIREQQSSRQVHQVIEEQKADQQQQNGEIEPTPNLKLMRKRKFEHFIAQSKELKEFFGRSKKGRENMVKSLKEDLSK